MHLFADLQSIRVNKITKICSFSIKNMYSIISKLDTMNTIHNISTSNLDIDQNISKEILHILLTTLQQGSRFL